MSVKKLVLIVFILLAALAAGLLGLLAWVLSPDAPAPDLLDRAPQQRVVTRTDAVPAPGDPFLVSGVVVHEDGSPAPQVEIEARLSATGEQHGSFTDDAGHFSLEVTGPAEIRPEDLPSTPWSFPVSGPRDDLRFVVPELCPVRVLVLDPTGEPISDGFAAARVASGAWNRRWTRYQPLDDQGRVTLDHVACGVGDIQARASGYVGARVRDLDTMTTQDVTLTLTRGVGLSGTVTNGAQEPLAGVTIQAGLASGISDEDGHYALKFDPGRTTSVRARAPGYVDQEERLRVDPGSADIVLDWELEASREVTVYCAGLPDDSCADVMPLMCTRPYMPFGEGCESGDPTVCVCPGGTSAVRGGGQSVEVSPGQQVAWLDFRATGGLRGRVSKDGAAVGCTTFTLRLPEDLSDVSRGGIAGRTGTCDDDGVFEVLGLEPGSYQVEVVAGEQNRRPDPVVVADTVVDLGVVDLDGGTDVAGVVLDGLTGQGAPGEAVVAVQSVAEGKAPGTSVTVSRSEGRFVLRGLGDGDWSVFLASRPFSPVDVHVGDGQANHEPVLETGAADLLGEQGFGLATDDVGTLVVQDLDPDGGAALAGLEDGDRVVGVTLMGMDLGSWMPGLEDQLLDAVLEHYSGPGVGLVVERDGETVEIDLD